MSSEAHHEDPSKNWLIFFFVCFTVTVFAIGLWAFFNYKVDAPTAAPGAHESMILPTDKESAPYARPFLLS